MIHHIVCCLLGLTFCHFYGIQVEVLYKINAVLTFLISVNAEVLGVFIHILAFWGAEYDA